MHVNSPNTHKAPSPTGSPLVQVPDPEFEGQTKTRLGNPEVRKIVEGIVGQVRVCSPRVQGLRISTPAQGLESSLFCGSSSLLQHGAAVLRADSSPLGDPMAAALVMLRMRTLRSGYQVITPTSSHLQHYDISPTLCECCSGRGRCAGDGWRGAVLHPQQGLAGALFWQPPVTVCPAARTNRSSPPAAELRSLAATVC